MPLSIMALAVGAAFIFAFRVYGRFVASRYFLDDARPTPAVTNADGVDFVPTSKAVLLAQHFASIAAAGPVIGPITAALAFGWGPSLAWIVLGCIFIGACHDFSSLVASMRHGARSIPEMVKLHLGKRAYALSLAFIWLSLLYVIVAFTDVTARQFVAVDEWNGQKHEIGGGVATSSFLYLLLSVAMGFATERFGMSLTKATLIFVPLLFAVIGIGQFFPIVLPFSNPILAWGLIIVGYCAVASVVPMWALLQPRGYLGGYFLYITLAIGVLGLLFGGLTAEFPAIQSFNSAKLGPMFPFMFVTIACGACSGFHGLVCCGTTCKQVSKESHTPTIAYGGMLLEGVVAVMALATVMMWPADSANLKAGPSVIYARGIAEFANAVVSRTENLLGVQFGIDVIRWGVTFGMLAFATFVYDTLDVATRLGRYLLEELLGLKGNRGRLIATVATLGLPFMYLAMAPATVNMGGAPVETWRVVWTIFGSSNQLLAAMTMLLLSAWISREWKSAGLWVQIPGVLMLVVTLVALVLQFKTNLSSALAGPGVFSANGFNAALALSLMVIAVLFTAEWWKGRASARAGAPNAATA